MTVVKEEMYDVGDRTYYNVVVDHAEAHNINDDRKKDPARGFSPNRMFQHIGAVPVHVWHAHAKKVGYYEMDKDKRKEEIIRFLNEFRGWSTVESIRTYQPSEANIIIK
jgi:hypothetical protein